MALRLVALAFALSVAWVGSSWAELPPPTQQQAAEEAEKKAAADAHADKQAEQLAASMDRVAERYRSRMTAMGKTAPAPVPVAAVAEQKKEQEQFKEDAPPSVHSASPTTTQPPTGGPRGGRVESVPGDERRAPEQ